MATRTGLMKFHAATKAALILSQFLIMSIAANPTGPPRRVRIAPQLFLTQSRTTLKALGMVFVKNGRMFPLNQSTTPPTPALRRLKAPLTMLRKVSDFLYAMTSAAPSAMIAVIAMPIGEVMKALPNSFQARVALVTAVLYANMTPWNVFITFRMFLLTPITLSTTKR